MGSVFVEFLGKKYEFSEAIKQYLGYEAEMAKAISGLNEALVETKKKDVRKGAGSWIEDAEEDVYRYRGEMRKIAEHFVGVLIDNGIYDVTADDLIARSESYGKIEDVTVGAANKALSAAREVVAAQEMGVSAAYSSAASGISGSGLRIFTSSLTTLAVMSAVEGGILMSQAQQADKEYQEAVESLRIKTFSALDRIFNQVGEESYYPLIAYLFAKYGDDLMVGFLTEMGFNGKFDFDGVKRFNRNKAEEMLENFDRVPDKREFLRMCFEECPYCGKVFEKCFEAGLMDTATYRTAEYFGFAEVSIDGFVLQCRKNEGNSEKFEGSVTLFTEVVGIDRLSALSLIYEEKIADVKESLKGLSAAVHKRNSAIKWAEQYVSGDARKLCAIDSGTLVASAEKVLVRALTRETFNKIDDVHLMGAIGLPGYIRGMSYEDAIDAAANAVASSVGSALVGAKAHIGQCEKEIEEMKRIREDRAEACKSVLEKLAEAKNKLNGRLLLLGFFAFSEKRLMRELIDRVEKCSSTLEVDAGIAEMDKAIRKRKEEMKSASALWSYEEGPLEEVFSSDDGALGRARILLDEVGKACS